MQPQSLYFFLFLFIILLPYVKPDLGSEREALLALQSAVGGRTRLWNVTQQSPCSWAGVQCDDNHVTALRLPGVALSGQIPTGIFGNLTHLRTLSLRLNALKGQLPADLASCASLRNLYLQGNLLSGEIPEVVFSLHDLVRLNLASNNFSGAILLGLNNLTRLRTLFLENNHLLGSIPALNLEKLEQFNVSNNLLNGSVPGKFQKVFFGCIFGEFALWATTETSRKKTSSVDIATVKHPEVEIPGDKPVSDVENGGYSNGYSVAAAAAAAMVGNGKSEANNGGAKKLLFFGNSARVFDLEDLLRASAEVLGKGTFGTAYKAVLEGLLITAGMKSFLSMITCQWEAYLHFLHGNKGAGRTPLNWEMRSGIALGAARGIEYLHSQGSNISHGNIKSSNILLTKSYNARVSDFGLAHLVGPSSTPNRVAGYRAPEVTDPRKVSQKADVYSFGVLLLELLTGKAPTHALLNEEGVDLPRWVQSIVREEWTSEVFDLELLRDQNVEEEMVQLLQLAVDCAASYPDKRPSMSEVTKCIEELHRASLRENHEQQPDAINDTDDISSSSR
ncbi:Receptor-like kinase 1 [Quillaja saponaria]|uniref:Receptor-like kinase 1 n=1 Tax=Quillaja saponaria TaxID=32244 RepID=A0AAD7VH46_QUISA|nr:Receptor-like kinase 1 [Quillaja saponaria]